MVELDDSILERIDLGGNQRKKHAEKGRLYSKDGKEVEKPETETEPIRTSLYRIKDSRDLGISEEYYLSVDKNKERMKNGKMPVNGYEKDISFGQMWSGESVREKRELVTKMVQTRLDPVRESVPKSESEKKQDEQLKIRKPGESLEIRVEHLEELVDKCLKIPEVQAVYNRQDVIKKVRKAHRTSMSDKEIIQQIEVEANMEHDFYNHGKREG